MKSGLTHVNEQGEARMVDVGAKDTTERRATAQTFVTMSAATLEQILEGQNRKGDVFTVARIAGIQAAKRCAELIPLCHPLALTHIQVEILPHPDQQRVELLATCALAGKTGVEMEALTAVSVAALTIYDMCKAMDKEMTIGPTRLLRKSGGRSGDWVTTEETAR